MALRFSVWQNGNTAVSKSVGGDAAQADAEFEVRGDLWVTVFILADIQDSTVLKTPKLQISINLPG